MDTLRLKFNRLKTLRQMSQNRQIPSLSDKSEKRAGKDLSTGLFTNHHLSRGSATGTSLMMEKMPWTMTLILSTSIPTRPLFLVQR